MNREQFITLIEHPEKRIELSHNEISMIIDEFPYWQSARMLYLKALHNNQHFSYSSQLKLTSIYAGNRKKLFELIHNGNAASPGLPRNANILKSASEIESPPETEISLKKDEEMHRVEEDLKVETAPLNSGETDNLYHDLSNLISGEQINPGIIETEPHREELNIIIEQRIRELSMQDPSNAVEESPEKEKNDAGEGTVVTEQVQEEQVSVEEEIAAIDIYEETAIAGDVFKEETTAPATEQTPAETGTFNDTAEDKAIPRSFLDWLKIYRGGENEPKENTESIREFMVKETMTPGTVSDTAGTDEQPDNVRSGGGTQNQTPDKMPGEEEANKFSGPSKPEEELINKFLQTEPRILPGKNMFYSPSEAARKSVVYDDEIVSETLAEIFARQQLFEKAIKAFEKLSLKFPEKSTLFAARIEKIKEESRPGKDKL